MPAGGEFFHHLPVTVESDLGERRNRPHRALDRYCPARGGEPQNIAGQFAVDAKVKQRPGGEKRVTTAQTIEPRFRGEWSIQMNVRAEAADQVGAVEVVDRVLASGRDNGQVVIQRVMPHAELCPASMRPFYGFDGS